MPSKERGLGVRTIVLAGGLGTRLSEETVSVPKPMVTIGGKPMLWHIMKIYSHYGHRDFILCLGYKGEVIKEWLLNLDRFDGSFEIDLSTGALKPLGDSQREPWTVTALDTGQDTQTGGRLKRALEAIEDSEVFVTYGDGVADVDIDALLAFHRSHGRLATVTAVRPPARFGRLHIDDAQVTRFGEKTQSEEGWINGGFFVLDRRVLGYISSDDTLFEKEPLSQLAAEGQLMAFRHEGYWQPMDTLRERQDLEHLWGSGEAPWAVWEHR
jgi:glucose-1-phosphate cytidylyltransferase